MNCEPTPQYSVEAARAYLRALVVEQAEAGGEVNATHLAEDACAHFWAYGPGPDRAIPEELFDLAHEIATEFEAEAASGPVVNGERFAPGYSEHAARYEQHTRNGGDWRDVTVLPRYGR